MIVKRILPQIYGSKFKTARSFVTKIAFAASATSMNFKSSLSVGFLHFLLTINLRAFSIDVSLHFFNFLFCPISFSFLRIINEDIPSAFALDIHSLTIGVEIIILLHISLILSNTIAQGDLPDIARKNTIVSRTTGILVKTFNPFVE